MAGPTKAVVDLEKLSFNLKSIRKRVGSGVRVCPAVKADAYGHGAVEVSRRLERDGADMLAVAHLEEGIELRSAGISLPILLLGAVLKEYVGEIIRWRFRPIITDISIAEELNKAAENSRPLPVHIKVDTGMGRLGFLERDALDAAKRINSLENIILEGALTHFASSDEKDKSFTYGQIERFQNIISAVKNEGINIPIIHSANSAAIIEVEESYFNMVRPGIMLYGLLPSREVSQSTDIKPIMKVVSKIVHIKRFPPGRPLSYGRTFLTERETLAGVVPVGYGDGYNRLLSNRAGVLVAGTSAPVIGRVCMDQILIDITEIPGIMVGAGVVIYSDNRTDANSVENIAEILGTIPNEVVCAISKRVPRKYLERRQ